MTKNQKAIKNLKDKDILAKEENGLVYVMIGDIELEIAQFEIDYQSAEYNLRKQKLNKLQS